MLTLVRELRRVMEAFLQKYFPEDGDAMPRFHGQLESVLPEQGALLDLGCGDLQSLACYRTTARQVWGADFQAHPRLHDCAWFRPLSPDGTIPFSAESFDAVTAVWVLEHVAEPAKFLGEVSRVLRPGGQFIAITVDARHYVAWLTRFLACLPHSVTQTIVKRLYGRPP